VARIWIVAVGEPLQTDAGHPRIMRAGLLAELLAKRGHDVVWWTSRFDHATKLTRTAAEITQVSAGLTLKLLNGRPYKRNVSVNRLIHQHEVAQDFALKLRGAPEPDVIYCSYPTIELSLACIDFGASKRVPVIVDIRDLWPDIFVEVLPRALKFLGELPLRKYANAKAKIFSGADVIVGTSDSFVSWGAKAAQRQKNPLDQSFPHAYQLPTISAEAEASARDWLNSIVGADPDTAVVCFFGNFADHVLDLDTVIAAARVLSKKGENFKFVLCGEGVALARLRLIASDVESVVLPGRIDASRIQALLKRSVCGLVPYLPRWDFKMAIPNKAIEYLAGSLPVVTCLDGDLAALIKAHECGVYYEAKKAPALAELLTDLRANSVRRDAMSQRAFALFTTQFEFGAVYNRFADLVQEAATKQ
jgi:glycosyltransferase involved in cell wall biosynthesis